MFLMLGEEKAFCFSGIMLKNDTWKKLFRGGSFAPAYKGRGGASGVMLWQTKDASNNHVHPK